MSDHFNLALPIYRDAVAPLPDRSAPDPKRAGQRCAATEVSNGVLDVHPVSMAWLTDMSRGTLVHGIRSPAYKEGMETINDRIKRLVEEDPRSQAEIARALGVTRATVGDWVHARSKFIRPDNIDGIAREYGVDPSWLATGKGDPKPPELDPDMREIARYLRVIPPASRAAIKNMVRQIAEDQSIYGR